MTPGAGPACRKRAARRLPGLAALVVAGFSLAGCAEMGEPPGGPPDLVPPRVLTVTPESLATGVDRLAPIAVAFSEKVDHAAVREWFSISPYRPLAHVDWKGGVASFRFENGLPADTTVVFSIGTGVRDRAGNPLGTILRRAFSTGPRLAPGRIAGRLLRSHRAATAPASAPGPGRKSPAGTSAMATARNEPAIFLWLYTLSADTLPDPLHDNPDLSIEVDRDGRFEADGLPVGRRYRILALFDGDRSRGPGSSRDYWAWHPDTLSLTADRPRNETMEVLLIDPKSPGSISGSVVALVDSTAADTLKTLVLVVERPAGVDSAGLTWPPTSSGREAPLDAKGRFAFRSLRPGRYRLAAFLDVDRSGRWSLGDRPGDWREVEVRPDEESKDLLLPRPPRPPDGASP